MTALLATPPTKTLNAGQQAAADGFFQFLFEPHNEMIISGPGGVGKTFLMGHLIDEIMPQYHRTCLMMGIKPEYDQVVMAATTNKAAEVLSVSTGRPTETIHSFLNLKVTDDFATGKSKLTKTGAWTVHQKKIVFIDESSMIDGDLLAMIREGTCKCKIIYVGDHCQLSPIMEPISPIYNQRLPFFELTEPMRTGDQDLQAINDQLRQTVETGVFGPIRVVPGVIDYLDDAAMQAEIDATFQSVSNDSRILAYTNKRVVAYNDYIREIRQFTDTYTVGERLINNSSIQLKAGSRLRVEEEIVIEEIADHTEHLDVEDGVTLEIRRCNFHSNLGCYRDIPLPEDKNHFTALVAHYKRQKNWNRYFYLKNHFPDLRPRDAATMHKAQGSSHDTVMIDLGDLSTCHNPNQAARLLYVGFSRARNRVILYGSLAAKYGSLIQ
jgi:exodeoxyribonuclease-5